MPSIRCFALADRPEIYARDSGAPLPAQPVGDAIERLYPQVPADAPDKMLPGAYDDLITSLDYNRQQAEEDERRAAEALQPAPNASDATPPLGKAASPG